MHRIDAPGAGPGNSFTEGNPATATPATVVGGAWAQAVQEELCGVIEAAGIVLSKPDNTQLLAAILTLGSGAGSNPAGLGSNLLINGDMRIFQRATSAPGGVLSRVLAAATAPTYGLDRWRAKIDNAGLGAATVSRQSFTAGQTDVPGLPAYYLRHLQSVAASIEAPSEIQRVEDVTQFGGAMTFGCYMKAGSAMSVTLRIVQNFGAGGHADVVAATQLVSVTTAWQRFSISAVLPSFVGFTIGAGSYLSVEIVMPTALAFTLDVADADLKNSATLSNFQRRALTTEMELARRYYEKSWSPDVAAATCPAGYDGATQVEILPQTNSALTMNRRFQTNKRVVPVVHWFSIDTQVADAVRANSTDIAAGISTNSGVSSTGFPDITVSLVGQTRLGAHWTADAEL